jgi:hypothetical protein
VSFSVSVRNNVFGTDQAHMLLIYAMSAYVAKSYRKIYEKMSHFSVSSIIYFMFYSFYKSWVSSSGLLCRNHFEDLCLGGKIILKFTSK